MMAYRAVIFDFFDVIHRDPFNHWIRQHGLERAGKLEEAARLFDMGKIDLEEHHRRVSKATGKPVDGIKASFDDISWIDREMVALVRSLKKNYKTCLLSNSATEYLGKIIDLHDLESLFDALIISADVGLIKPDPRIFEHTLNELGVPADEAVFIDDNPRNTEAASRLGIKGIAYDGDIGKLKKELANSGINV